MVRPARCLKKYSNRLSTDNSRFLPHTIVLCSFFFKLVDKGIKKMCILVCLNSRKYILDGLCMWKKVQKYTFSCIGPTDRLGFLSMLNLFTSQIMKINRQWGAAHFYRYHFVFLNKDFVFFRDFGGTEVKAEICTYCSRVELPLVPPWSSQPAKYHIFQINLKYASTINRKEGQSTIFYLLHSHNP